jgi:PadR family transcriptional regulator
MPNTLSATPVKASSTPYEWGMSSQYPANNGTLQNMVSGRQQSLISQLRRGTIEYCVLALLEREPRYGFDLVRELGAVDGMVTSEGTIYPLLARLRRDRLVETVWRESPSGPPRRYYELTNAGKQALREFVEEWGRFSDAVDGLLRKGTKS